MRPTQTMNCGLQASMLHWREHAASCRRGAAATKAASERGRRGQRKAHTWDRVGERAKMTSSVIVSGGGARIIVGVGSGGVGFGVGQSGGGMSPENDSRQKGKGADRPRVNKEGMEL